MACDVSPVAMFLSIYPGIIYKVLVVTFIFNADGRTKVFQEVLADLKISPFSAAKKSTM